MVTIHHLLRAVALVSLIGAASANAATIVSNFNDYPSDERLLNTNYGSGWPAGFETVAQVKWGENSADGTSSGTSSIVTTPGDLVAPPATGYSLTQPVITAARSVTGTATLARRQSRETGGLTGDIWMSWLMAPSADARLGLNLNGNVKGFNGADNVRVIALGSSFNVYGPGTNSATGIFTADETALILGLLQMDTGGGNDDRLRLWVNPNVGLGEADVLTNQPTVHNLILDQAVMGGSLDTVGIVAYAASGNPGRLDSLRISNDPGGFGAVTGVPEPGSVALFGASGLFAAFAFSRRRSRRQGG